MSIPRVQQRPDDDRDGGLERLGDSEDFAAELERLAALAPEPWRSQLYAIAQTGRRVA